MEAFWGFGQLMRQQIIPSVVGEHGLDFKDFITLTSISEGAVYPKNICERLSTNASDVSRILETLSKASFIKRELDTDDSRRVLVSLTPAGATVLQTARERIQQLISDAEDTIQSDDLEKTAQTLLQLQQIMRSRIAQQSTRTDSS